VVAAAKPAAAELAGRIGDGMWNVAPDASVVEAFRSAGGGEGAPVYGGPKLLYGPDEAACRAAALEMWPNAAAPGDLSQELRDPEHFDQLSELVTEDMVASAVPLGPDVERYVESIRTFADAGFSHVHVTQIGPDQEAFFGFFERTLGPALRSAGITG
jgi:G6PDH family F420-dependent oxidoreductase